MWKKCHVMPETRNKTKKKKTIREKEWEAGKDQCSNLNR